MSNGIYRVQTVRTTVSQIFNPLRRPSARCLIVAARARQTIFLASRRAGARVGKMHREEILVGPALLRFPVGPAVLRRQDCPAVPGHSACVRVDKMHAPEILLSLDLLLLPVGPAIAAKIVPPSLTTQPVCASTTCTLPRFCRVPIFYCSQWVAPLHAARIVRSSQRPNQRQGVTRPERRIADIEPLAPKAALRHKIVETRRFGDCAAESRLLSACGLRFQLTSRSPV
jgi:hypothetical protein